MLWVTRGSLYHFYQEGKHTVRFMNFEYLILFKDMDVLVMRIFVIKDTEKYFGWGRLMEQKVVNFFS